MHLSHIKLLPRAMPPARLQEGILEEAGFPGCAQMPGKTVAALKPAKLGLQVFPGVAPDHLLLGQAGGLIPQPASSPQSLASLSSGALGTSPSPLLLALSLLAERCILKSTALKAGLRRVALPWHLLSPAGCANLQLTAISEPFLRLVRTGSSPAAPPPLLHWECPFLSGQAGGVSATPTLPRA